MPTKIRKQIDNNAMEIENGRAPNVSFTEERAITMADNNIDTRDIFVGTREVTITHGGERYRLRLTAQNKLILTK
jgi:hemin uptake protein HemP